MNKFYVPKIEEFHIGFKHQQLVWETNMNDHLEKGVDFESDFVWEDAIVDEDFISEEGLLAIHLKHPEADLLSRRFRVKCLDNEDIEELGWEHSPDDSNLSGGYWLDCYYLHVGLDAYMLRYCAERKTVRINYKHSVYDSDTLFFGRIKNYNKLKDVMEMLKIK